MSVDLSNPIFNDEAEARRHFEAIRWPEGPYCPHCGNADPEAITKLTSKKHRSGLYQCRACREQFTVTVGSVMESSHVPLNKWALGFYLMASSKKGISAHQLMRQLGLGSYRTAWFMAHRIREAMKPAPRDFTPMGGEGKIVEADETYHGKLETPRKRNPKAPPLKNKGGKGTKRAIFGLVERGGEVRTFHIQRASAAHVRDVLVKNVSRKSTLHTDEAPVYTRVGQEFDGHKIVTHSRNEYVAGNVHTNTVENVWSVFKRGMHGTYQHCGEAHLHRYLAEFDFRYNRRSALGIDDAMRAEDAIRGAAEKRLMYGQPRKA